jgi:hypothetical protein
VWGKGNVHTGFWWGNLREGEGRPKRRWEDKIKMYFNICFTVHFYNSTLITPTNALTDIYLD